MDIELTDEEKGAIRALKKLAKTWPNTLWIFSASGSLRVLRVGPDGYPVHIGSLGGVDPAYVVADIVGIRNDGGDS